MTRQAQNAIILQALNDKIIDIPNVNDAISKAFDQWFATLLVPPMQPVQETPPEEAAA